MFLNYITCTTTYRETAFSGIGYLPLKFKLIGYLQILIGYCLNSYGKRHFSPICSM